VTLVIEPPVIFMEAEDCVAIEAKLAVLIAVINPLALTVITGTTLAEPKLPTLALTVARVTANETLPVPLKAAEVPVASPVMSSVRAVVH
jgi:hypothetical protein